MLPLILALACRDKPADAIAESPSESSVDSRDSQALSRFTGERDDEGFGYSLVADAAGVVWVGAPFGETGRVYSIDGADTIVRMEEASFGALGTGLARTDAGVVAGAPLAEAQAGQLVGADGVLAQGQTGALLGGRIDALGAEIAATSRESVWLGTQELTLGERPGDLAFSADGALYVGLPRGEGGIATAAGRYPLGAAQEEVGAALCVADLDGDGLQELAVGAPGAGRVYLVPLIAGLPEVSSARTLELGSGRFGASLACAPGELIVGAPTRGEEATGAVWALDAGRLASGELGDPIGVGDPGSDLGAAVLWLDGAIWAGAPGASEVHKLR